MTSVSPRVKTWPVSSLSGDAKLEQRFWSKVDFDGPTSELVGGQCWLWTACTHRDGHGKFGVGRQTVYAHRLAYEAIVGPITAGLVVDHLCRVPACVNPEHLEPVTNAENTLRGEAFSAQQARRTECPEGHPYNYENTYLWRGHRRCRIFNTNTAREYRRRVRNSKLTASSL